MPNYWWPPEWRAKAKGWRERADELDAYARACDAEGDDAAALEAEYQAIELRRNADEVESVDLSPHGPQWW